MPTPKDYRGNPLNVGTLVAFNLSGAVEIGLIESFKYKAYPRADWEVGRNIEDFRHGKFTFVIRGLDKHNQPRKGKTSNINHQRNLVALMNLPNTDPNVQATE